jgi:hypothetical protein
VCQKSLKDAAILSHSQSRGSHSSIRERLTVGPWRRRCAREQLSEGVRAGVCRLRAGVGQRAQRVQ